MLFLGIVALIIYIISTNTEIVAWILVGLSCFVMLGAIAIGIYKLIKKSKGENISSDIFSFPIKKSTAPINTRKIVTEIPKLNTNYNEVFHQSTSEFRAKYPFVMVDVHPLQQSQFIIECEWLQSKIGHFPSEADQQAILKSLGNVAE